jgi:hypothetical protein
MKRNERTIYNRLRKLDTRGLINVEVRHEYSAEAQQAIHEVLTIEKGLYAVRVCPSLLDYEPCTLYIPAGTREQLETRRMQETMSAADVIKALPVSEYTWNGYKRPARG